MANIHGIRDLNNPNNPNRNNPPGNNYQNLNPGIADQIPFMNSMRGDQRPPMDQTIHYTLKIICCPDFKVLSTSLIFLVACWVIYIICLTQGIQKKNNVVLQISTDVLINFGAAQGSLVANGQIYRLLTASFLHANLMHLISNTISILFFVTRFQKIYPFYTPIILIVSSISGFMLSVLCNRTDISVGASTAIFGVLGGLVSYLIINWQVLGRYGSIRSTLACLIGVLVGISLLFSIGSSIDAIAHIGGFIAGLFISLAILPGIEEKSRTLLYCGVGGIAVMNLVTFLTFYLTN